MPRFSIAAAAIIGATALAVTGAWAQADGTARADLADPQGRPVGTVTLTQFPHGVLIRADLAGLPPGWHGFHIHAVGRCEGPAFESAGGHFAPADHKHGFDRDGVHAGDLPNIHAGADGRAVAEFLTNRIALHDAADTDGPPDIFDDDGAAIVVHAEPDDYRTDPAGAAGDRIACGVIRRAG